MPGSRHRPFGTLASVLAIVVTIIALFPLAWMVLAGLKPEREVLSAFPYQRNDTVLHTDSSLLPRCRRAWASWNYHVPGEDDRPVVLTYNLNRLQGHQSPDPICVTLNATQALDEHKIIRRIEYHHPTYSGAAVAAQKRHAEINGKNRTYFCGAYWGYGFPRRRREERRVASASVHPLLGVALGLGDQAGRIAPGLGFSLCFLCCLV
jgi:predicted NAD/FAD-binding protein